MNNEIREQVLGVAAGLRGEKRASKGKAIGGALSRAWELLSGSRADRLAGAKFRLTEQLRRLGYQMEALTKDLDRSSPDPRNWSFPQTGQLGMPPLFSKNQAKVLNSSKWPSAASQNKALDAEIAAIGRRSSARRDALQHVGKLLDREQWAVDAARITGVAAGGAGLGAGYGLHSLLGGKGDGEKKAAEALGVGPAQLEKRAAKGNAAANALRWVKAYMGRGSRLRGAIRNAERANADLASKGQLLKELLGKRTADAALLRKYRPLAGEVTRLATTGELVGHEKMTRLNDKFFRLADESRLGRPNVLMGLGYPRLSGGFDISGGVAFPKSRLDYSDLARVKAFLAPHRSVKADKQAIEELKQYLGTNSVRSTDVLRGRLRRYYLANTAAGVAGAGALGGAGYGVYRAVGGEA